MKKRIIELTPKDSERINVCLYMHQDLAKEVPWEVKDFTIRYNVNGHVLVLETRIDRKGFHFVGAEENGMLQMKRHFPSFHFSATLHDGKVNITSMTKDEQAVLWLTKRNGQRNAVTEFIYLALHSSVVLTHFESILQKRETEDAVWYSLPQNFQESVEKLLVFRGAEERKNKLLDGWDVVSLTEKQFYKVIEMNQQKQVEYDLDNIPLNRFCLSIFDGKETDYYFFEKTGRTIKCGVTDPGSFVTKFFDVQITGKSSEGIGSTLHVDDREKGLWNWLNEVINDDGGTNWEWCADAFFIINTFMLHYGDVAMDVETKIAQQQTENRAQRRKNKTNTVRLFKTYKLVKNWRTQARKKAEITCPAWGVRGHFRHYRNGKTVFVEAYIKGKEKDKYKGKEYALLPYRDA